MTLLQEARGVRSGVRRTVEGLYTESLCFFSNDQMLFSQHEGMNLMTVQSSAN